MKRSREMMKMVTVITIGLLFIGCACDEGEWDEIDTYEAAQETQQSLKCVRYVDALAPSDGDGLSWETAFDSLESAVEAIEQLDSESGEPCEIRVSDDEVTGEQMAAVRDNREINNNVLVRLISKNHASKAHNGDIPRNGCQNSTIAQRLATSVNSGDQQSSDAASAAHLKLHTAAELSLPGTNRSGGSFYDYVNIIGQLGDPFVRLEWPNQTWQMKHLGEKLEFNYNGQRRLRINGPEDNNDEELTIYGESGTLAETVLRIQEGSHAWDLIVNHNYVPDLPHTFTIEHVYGSEDARLQINSDGEISSGTSAVEKLNLGSATGRTAVRLVERSGADAIWEMRAENNIDNKSYNSFSIYGGEDGADPNDDKFPSRRLVIRNNGNVGIGTVNPGRKLTVNGGIKCEEIEVVADIADYVFADDYNLMSLDEVENFITENRHLPGIASEDEVERNGGTVSVGESYTKLLEKVEELTLHLIDQNKQLRAAQKRIAGLEKTIAQSRVE